MPWSSDQPRVPAGAREGGRFAGMDVPLDAFQGNPAFLSRFLGMIADKNLSSEEVDRAVMMAKGILHAVPAGEIRQALGPASANLPIEKALTDHMLAGTRKSQQVDLDAIRKLSVLHLFPSDEALQKAPRASVVPHATKNAPFQVTVAGQRYFCKGEGEATVFRLPHIKNELVTNAALGYLTGGDRPAMKMATLDGKPALVSTWFKGEQLHNCFTRAKNEPNSFLALPKAAIDRNLLASYLCNLADRNSHNWMIDGPRLNSIDHEWSMEPSATMRGNWSNNFLATTYRSQRSADFRSPMDPTMVKDFLSKAPQVLQLLQASGYSHEVQHDFQERTRAIEKLFRKGDLTPLSLDRMAS